MELVVSELRSQVIEINVLNGVENILSIEVLDADGNPAGRAQNIDSFYGSQTARIGNLSAQPNSIRVLLATDSAEHEVPFTVEVGGEQTADYGF